ncbi:hypothetical protein KCU95_g12292, partial [Aureobasidium melanogenum]
MFEHRYDTLLHRWPFLYSWPTTDEDKQAIESERNLQHQEDKAKFSQMLAKQRVNQVRQRRRLQFEHMLKECNRSKTICCCQLRTNLTWYGANRSHNRRYLKRLLRRDDDSRNPYAHLSKEDAQIELAARGVCLKKDANNSRYALRCALQVADAQRQIDFLRLPKEVRLLVYEHVVSDDPVGLARPTLLAVNKQIRDEASPIFFRLNSFRLDLYPGYYIANAPKFDLKTYKWLDLIGPDGIKELRNISLTSNNEEYNIDLSCGDAGQWSTTLRPRAYTSRPHHSRQKCSARKTKTLEAHLADARKAVEGDVEDMAQSDKDLVYLKNLFKQKEFAHKCIQDGMDTFAALCGEGKSVEPTIDGLEILIDAIALKDQKTRDFANALSRREV